MFSPEQIIILVLELISNSDGSSIIEKSVISSYIKTKGFINSRRLQSFRKKQMSNLDLEIIIKEVKALDLESKNILVKKITSIISSDGIISNEEAALTAIICNHMDADHIALFDNLKSLGLNVKSYDDFISSSIPKEEDRREIGFLATQQRSREKNV